MTSFFDFYRKNKFKSRWINYISLIGIIPIILSSILFFIILEKHSLEEDLKHGHMTAESLKDFLTEDFLYLDYGNITSKLTKLNKKGEFNYLLAYDSSGSLLFDTRSLVNQNNLKKDHEFLFESNLFDNNGSMVGKIVFSLNRQKFSKKTPWIILTISIITFSISILLIFILFRSIKQLLTPYEEILLHMSELAKGNLILFDKYLHVDDERKILNTNYNEIMKALSQYQEEMANSFKKNALSEMARQVSHDIRSPLSVLNMTINSLKKRLNEEERILLLSQTNRIQDIANDLLSKNKIITAGKQSLEDHLKNGVCPELLSSCIEEIITEKRIEARPYLSINIYSEIYHIDSYGLFAEINASELKRILSNLINNSIEALVDKKGTISVSLKGEESSPHLKIIITDSGKGIPPEILPLIGQEGQTFGKDKIKLSGSGLGLYHARKTLKRWGGSLSIESKLGEGTSVTISLPRSKVPSWFVPFIQLKGGSSVLILDDDIGIHKSWDALFETAGIHKSNIQVVHLSNPEDFRNWFKQNENSIALENIFCLSDYELLGFKESGLDLIEEFKLLSSQTILVTSHYENANIRNRCNRIGVKLIPKMLTGSVPILIDQNNPRNKRGDKKLEGSKEASLLVAIISKDENNIACVQNQLSNLEKEKIELHKFDSHDHFLQSIKNKKYQKNICFIDSNSIRGTEIAANEEIKYYHLLDAHLSFFDIESEDHIALIPYPQRNRLITKIVNEHMSAHKD